MKKIITTIVLIFCLNSYSQELKGILETNVKKIKRESGFVTDITKPIESKGISNEIITPTGTSTEVGITEGSLSVSLTGAANYNIPIVVPKGINGVEPKLSLNYNSQGGNGIAGYGWEISGLSTITRIPSTQFHDGIIDAVDGDDLDRFSLDGQRLILKTPTTGTYLTNGAVFETENFSNIKVTYILVGQIGHFLVEYPDGSTAKYGNTINSQNNTTYAISEWNNVLGISIKYLYNLLNNSIYISSVEYGSKPNEIAINIINFEYSNRYRSEESYINGLLVKADKKLSKIISKSSNTHFREYNLEYQVLGIDFSTINYDRLRNITESVIDNGIVKEYNPTVFNYNNTFDSLTYGNITASLTVGNIDSRYAETISGDFDGDGKMDFILYPTTGTAAKTKYWVFNDNTNSSSQLFDYEHNVGLFQKIMPISMLNAPVNGKYKLDQKQGWCVIKKNGNLTSFTNYFWDSVGIFPEYTRTYNFPIYNGLEIPKEYLSGDFNGDGLTDLMIINKSTVSNYNQAGITYFLDLDRRKTVGYINNIGIITLSNDSKFYVSDANGDGKSDILVFNNGIVKVYAIKENLLDLIWQSSNVNISIANDKIVLFGDYNGDGKSDFLIPSANNSNVWNKFTSTGISFVHEFQTYQQFNYQLNSGLSSKHYISTDFNHDGKSDLVLMSFDVTTINAASGTATMKCFKNINGQFNGGTGLSYSLTTPNTTGFNQFNLPIVYSSDRPNESLELGFIKGNKIYTFQSYKDFNIDKQLQTITTGRGVKEVISYKPLKPSELGTTSSYDNPDIYKAINGFDPQYYPFADIMSAPSMNVVSKLERFGNNYKKQFFTYYRAVQSMNGLGFLGFQETMQTNWFDSNQQGQYMISNVSKFDMTLRGANVMNFSTINYWYNFGQVPSSFISKNIKTYNVVNGVYVDPLLSNKVFKLIQNKTENFDGLKNTSSETNMIYNTYNNPTSVSTTIKTGTFVERTSNATIVYDTPSTSPYIIDRPLNKKENVTAYGDTRTTEEQYTYTALNQVETSKSKSMSSDFITTSYEYDTYGNVKKQTVSAPDLPVARITNYQFDPVYNGRFLTKIIDLDGLETTYGYEPFKGTLLKEVNPYSLKTIHTYDAWGKKTSTKDYLNNILTFGYSKTSNNTFTITKTMPIVHGGASIEVFDVLGRKIIAGEKNIQGIFSYVKTDFDNLDRAVKTYEPYFLNGADLYNFSPTNFTQSSYDGYSRISNVTYNTGKTETVIYNGLTTIVTSLADGLSKSKSSTNDAVGNMKSSTELPQGGTINYSYFANNEVKTTSYSGNTITNTIDNWGRKSSLKDPSAGIYTYTYNNLGEILTESTPKGVTTHTYDNFGKILTTTVVGKATNPPTTTNTLTTNVYNADKLLESTTFNDIENNVVTYYNYEYNSSKQPIKVIEKNGMFRFETQIEYDTFGRPLNQKQNAATLVSGTANINKQSEKWTTNVYQNGVLFKITDGQTTNGSGAILWQTNETNARGQLTKGQFGNNLYVQNQYDTTGRLLNLNHTNSETSGGISSFQMTYNWTTNPQRNLYNSRTFHHVNNYTENFTFDNLDRLTSFPNELGLIETQTYAENGRIATNGNGTYNYSTTSKPYRNSSIETNVASKNYYLNNALQQIKYSALKKPMSIYQESAVGVAKERIDFLYNAGDSRSAMFYGDTNPNKMARKFRRYYSSGGTMEITETRDASGNIIRTDFITYIAGDAYSAPIILKSDGATQTFLYLHRDNLSSILAISNQDKVKIEQRVFDAWGNLIKLININGQYVINNGQTLIANYNMYLDRGYTGHEHLLGIGLINMNGRLYDPKLHRFLMPDNNLQDPTNSQNFNRYGYVLNNPLKYNDPTGEDLEYRDPYDDKRGLGDVLDGFGDVIVFTGVGFGIVATGLALFPDWSNQNLNFNKWSDFGKSVGNFFSNNIKSGISDVKDFFNNSLKSTFGNKSPETTFAPANSYSFAPSGGTSSFVSSVSISPGGGYKGSAEMHPYVNQLQGFFKGAINSSIDDYISSFPVFDLIEKSGYELIPRMNVNQSQENYAMAGGLALALLTPGPGGEGKAALKYSDDLLDAAKKLYPNKALKNELHHITPKYLGGLANGALIELNAAYHQMITNAFRKLWGYGKGTIKDPKIRKKIEDQVYSQFPLPK